MKISNYEPDKFENMRQSIENQNSFRLHSKIILLMFSVTAFILSIYYSSAGWLVLSTLVGCLDAIALVKWIQFLIAWNANTPPSLLYHISTYNKDVQEIQYDNEDGILVIWTQEKRGRIKGTAIEIRSKSKEGLDEPVLDVCNWVIYLPCSKAI